MKKREKDVIKSWKRREKNVNKSWKRREWDVNETWKTRETKSLILPSIHSFIKSFIQRFIHSYLSRSNFLVIFKSHTVPFQDQRLWQIIESDRQEEGVPRAYERQTIRPRVHGNIEGGNELWTVVLQEVDVRVSGCCSWKNW